LYSNVDSHVLPQTEFNVEKLWAEGEVIKNHPRVRSARIGEQLVTVHRFSGTIPSGIKILIEHPDLAAVAGLKLANENFYVMDFVEGELLDSFPPETQLVQPLIQQMLRLWRFGWENLAEARRERPVIAPITPAQHVEMPDTVLSSAYVYSQAVTNALQRLADRGPGHYIIHGDLKADNIVRVDQDAIKFVDWECSGAGHPEDDVASLLSSLCIYGLGRAVRKVQDVTNGVSLHEHVTQELYKVCCFSNTLLQQLHQEAPEISTDFIGEAFLVSSLCRMQGILFVPSSEAMRLTVTEFVKHTVQGGPEAVRAWLTGGVIAEAMRTP